MQNDASPEQILDRMMQFWEDAVADPKLGSRIARAGTTVQIHFTDVLTPAGEPMGFTLLLDRDPCEVVGGFLDAEVELYAPAKMWFALARGHRRTAMAIAEGDITYNGPVRKFLRIVPMLQNFDFAVWSGVRFERRTQDLGPPGGEERRGG